MELDSNVLSGVMVEQLKRLDSTATLKNPRLEKVGHTVTLRFELVKDGIEKNFGRQWTEVELLAYEQPFDFCLLRTLDQALKAFNVGPDKACG